MPPCRSRQSPRLQGGQRDRRASVPSFQLSRRRHSPLGHWLHRVQLRLRQDRRGSTHGRVPGEPVDVPGVPLDCADRLQWSRRVLQLDQDARRGRRVGVVALGGAAWACVPGRLRDTPRADRVDQPAVSHWQSASVRRTKQLYRGGGLAFGWMLREAGVTIGAGEHFQPMAPQCTPIRGASDG